MIKDLWDLCVAFFRAGNFGFGGGPAMIPLIQNEAVDRYGWMSNSEFAEAVAVTNALPGPIATKLAAYVGFKVASWPGVAVATAVTVLPTILLVVWAGQFLMKHAQDPGVQAALKGVRPVVAVLIGAVALGWMWDIMSLGLEHSDWRILGGSALIAVGAALGLRRKVHPAVLVAASMAVGGMVFR
ncbi:MAG: chromate transporter [Peptococcaceae bacterium]|nr:chromate transporter [Peptococcaceae bacterium]